MNMPAEGLKVLMSMRKHRFAVVVDERGNRAKVGFSAPASEKPAAIASKLRDLGWDPYRVVFDPRAEAWIAYILKPNGAA